MATVFPNNKLAWDYPFPMLVDGFRLYLGKLGEPKQLVWENTDRNVLEVSLSEVTLQDGAEYEAAVTAYLGNRESEMSGAINFTFAASVKAPTNLRITG